MECRFFPGCRLGNTCTYIALSVWSPTPYSERWRSNVTLLQQKSSKSLESASDFAEFTLGTISMIDSYRIADDFDESCEFRHLGYMQNIQCLLLRFRHLISKWFCDVIICIMHLRFWRSNVGNLLKTWKFSFWMIFINTNDSFVLNYERFKMLKSYLKIFICGFYIFIFWSITSEQQMSINRFGFCEIFMIFTYLLDINMQHLLRISEF